VAPLESHGSQGWYDLKQTRDQTSQNMKTSTNKENMKEILQEFFSLDPETNMV
jgi:hypothetical protein